MEYDSDSQSSGDDFVPDDQLEESGSSSSESELSDDSDGENPDDLLQARVWMEVDAKLPVGPAPPRYPFRGNIIQ